MERWRDGVIEVPDSGYSVTPSLQVLHFGAFGSKRHLPHKPVGLCGRCGLVGWGLSDFSSDSILQTILRANWQPGKLDAVRELHEFHELTRIPCEFVLLLQPDTTWRTPKIDQALAGEGRPGPAEEDGAGLRKLRHKCKGRRPSTMITSWLTTKPASHLNAPSIQP